MEKPEKSVRDLESLVNMQKTQLTRYETRLKGKTREYCVTLKLLIYFKIVSFFRCCYGLQRFT